ncbi:uncharacterized protein N7479_001975 [Penicillium vulpinum]|uniref:uncharacterized protein n=1 Tax=Penicillium vulpinum TaxID=29845 RepID=UPI002548A2B8|nr:uncharacterized protein N7479_001975 [Penicillium vulpinum]KAJ5972057.1 hypothetical protein N7479_001975 [Penicillium vulpinum]
MESDDAFLDAFLNACAAGDLSNTQEAIASGRLTLEDLDEGLALATYDAHPDIVATLFDAGARVSTYATGFLTGEEEQVPGIIRQFLDHGLDPNASVSGGEPLLRYIVPQEDTSLIDLLLTHGAKLESNMLFDTIAPRVTQGEFMTKFLLAKGLDPNTTSSRWGTPLHRAVEISKPNIIKLLLDAGADPTARPTKTIYYNRSPLQMAENSQSSRRQAMLSLLRS